jgi:TolB-like protein
MNMNGFLRAAACLALVLAAFRPAPAPAGELYLQRTGDGSGRIVSGAPLPGGDGVWSRSGETFEAQPEQAEARELRLTIREMADRLLEGGPGELAGMTIVPASFVSLDDFRRSSTFGKMFSEQLISEFSRLGLRVVEYRTSGPVRGEPGAGEFALSRNARSGASNAAVLTGTYAFDEKNVFINARLFRASDGSVLRASSMVMPQNPTTRQLLARGAAVRLAPAETAIKSFEGTAEEPELGSLFGEEDLH